ncbi:hypothetical protein R1sor_011066 [Riccia sorocarpa]|uniref:Uncharacterized protein n=1 Tax=Riccia sorocarpa TaxID=122646 RepID=A0ABD3HZT6_9MARC
MEKIEAGALGNENFVVSANFVVCNRSGNSISQGPAVGEGEGCLTSGKETVDRAESPSFFTIMPLRRKFELDSSQCNWRDGDRTQAAVYGSVSNVLPFGSCREENGNKEDENVVIGPKKNKAKVELTHLSGENDENEVH